MTLQALELYKALRLQFLRLYKPCHFTSFAILQSLATLECLVSLQAWRFTRIATLQVLRAFESRLFTSRACL